MADARESCVQSATGPIAPSEKRDAVSASQTQVEVPMMIAQVGKPAPDKLPLRPAMPEAYLWTR